MQNKADRLALKCKADVWGLLENLYNEHYIVYDSYQRITQLTIIGDQITNFVIKVGFQDQLGVYDLF